MPDWDDRRTHQTSAYSNEYAYQQYQQGVPTTPSYSSSYDRPHRSEATHGAPLPSQQEVYAFQQYPSTSQARNWPYPQRTDQPVGPRGYASVASPKLHADFFLRPQQPQSVHPQPAFNGSPPQAPPPYGSSAGARGGTSGYPTPSRRSGSSVFLGAQSTTHPSPSRPYNPGAPPAQTQARPSQLRAPAPWFPPARPQSPEESVPPQASAAAGVRPASKGLNVAGVNLPPVQAPVEPQETLNLASPSPSPERSPRARNRTLEDDDPEIVYQSSAKAPRHSKSSMGPIKPRDPTDPSYPHGKAIRGAGWESENFFGDADQPGPSLPSARKNTNTYGGKSTPFKAPRPSNAPGPQKSVASTSFHAPAQSSSSRGRKRVIQQDGPVTAGELAGRAAMQRVEKEQAKQTKQTKKRLDVKGKGKAKAPPTVIEINSDDSDIGELEALKHGYEDANDPIESDDDDDRRPSTSTAGPAKKASGSRARKSAALDGVGDSPSSPDPLSMNTTRSSEHRNKNAAPSTSTVRKASLLADSQPGVPVKQRVADYERTHQAVNKPRTTMVGSMGCRKGDFTRSGSPTDDAEFPQGSGKLPRAAKTAMAAGRQQAREAEIKVYEVEARPYLLGMVGLADMPEATCRVILTTSGDPSLDKLTLRTSRDGHDDGVEIKAGDAQEISFWPGSEQDDLDAYIYIRVRTQKLFEALIDMGPEPISKPGEKSVTIVLRNSSSLTEAWKDDPTTPEDHLFHSVVVGWPRKKNGTPAVQVSGAKAKATMEIYSGIADTIRDLERGRPGKSTKAKAKNAPDPKQTKLSFKLRQDEQGDYTESTPPASRAGRAARDDSPDPDIEFQSRSATRRSSRPSTSEYANVSRPPDSTSSAAAPVPVLTEEEKRYQQWLKENDAKYRPDEVVVEFPPGQPGAITLPWGDVKRLQPDEFLNDTLIEFGLKQILKRIEESDASLPDDKKLAPQVHIFNSFFYKQLSTPKKKGVDPYKLVEKWTKKVNLFEKRFIVVPINEHFHWYLAMIINPAALLQPPPPPTAAPPPRQSGRIQQRDSTVDTEDAPGTPKAENGEVTSRHFGKGRVPKALREQQELQAAPLVTGSEKAESDVDMLDESKSASPVDRDEQEHEERIARGIEAEMVDKGDPLAVSPSRAVVEHAAGALYSLHKSPPSQPEPAQMQIDSAPVETSAHDGPSVTMLDEDMIDMDMFQFQRGSLEGGGPSTHAPGTPSHKRWTEGADEGSPTREAGSPEVTFLHASREQPREAIGQEDDVVMPTPSQHENKVLAESLFGAAADAAIAEPAIHQSLAGSQTGKDDDDDVFVVSPAQPPTSTSATGHREGRPASAAKPTSSTTRKGPQPLVPQDPEPNRAEQLQREREEEERRQRERENAERVAREERQKQALLEAREAVDLKGCWILTFDSLGGYHKAVTNKLKGYLVSEAMSKLGKQPEELSIDQVQCGRADVPQQPNYCDCGLYLLHFVEHFLRNSDLLLNVIALNQPAVVKGGKKTQQAIAEAEAFRNDSWAFEEAKSRRARMRDEVKVLVEQYAEGAEERHHREEQEREQRRLKKEEANRRRQEEMDREIVRRAAESTTPAPEAVVADDIAHSGSAPALGAVDAPAGPLSFSIRGAAGLKNAPAGSKIHGLSIKGAATANNPQSSQAVLELSDEHSSTQGSPQKSLYALDQPNAAAWRVEPVTASSAVAPPVAATEPDHQFRFSGDPPAADSMADHIIAYSDEDGDLGALTNGVDDDAAAGTHGSPLPAPQIGEDSPHGRGRAATGELESSAVVDDTESAHSSEGMDNFAEPPRRKVDHGRAEPVEPAASAAVAAETAAAAPAEPTLVHNVGTEGSPELTVPAANQQQQQQQQQSEEKAVTVSSTTPGRPKRVLRSSTRGSSPPRPGTVVLGANGGPPDESSERPSKRVKQSGGGGGGTSATVSASSSKAASRASSPASADDVGADEAEADPEPDADADAEGASLAKNVGKKPRGRPATEGRARGRPKKLPEANPSTPTEEITIDSD